MTTHIEQELPVLTLRDVVVYPHMVIPLFVGREKSIVALDLAMKALTLQPSAIPMRSGWPIEIAS